MTGYIDIVDERIKVLSEIKDNWYSDGLNPDGIGKSYREDDLKWFREFWLKYFENKLDLNPYIFPTVEGGIMVEWDASKHLHCNLEINLDKKTGDVSIDDFSNYRHDIDINRCTLESVDLTKDISVDLIVALIDGATKNMFKERKN